MVPSSHKHLSTIFRAVKALIYESSLRSSSPSLKAEPRARFLPGADHRRRQLHHEQPGDLQRHQPVSRPKGGGAAHL